MARYEGPREFHADDRAALERDLRKLADQVDRLFKLQQDGGAERFAFADVARSDVALKTGYITPVTGSVPCTLPPWEAKLVGLKCGVERLSTSGTVTVRPAAGGYLNDVTTALTLPTALRIYLFIATRTGWKVVDDA